MAYCTNYGRLVQVAVSETGKCAPAVRNWMRRRLTEHLHAHPGAFVPVRSEDARDSWSFARDLPPRDRAAVEAVRAAHEASRPRRGGTAGFSAFSPPPGIFDEIAEVRSYLGTLDPGKPSAAARLEEMTFRQALDFARARAALDAAKAARQAEHEAERGSVEEVLLLKGGKRWIRLRDAAALAGETGRFASGDIPDGVEPEGAVFLRSALNETQCAVGLDRDRGFSWFAAAPRFRGLPALAGDVEGLAGLLAPPRFPSAPDIGAAWVAGKLHPVNAVPPGTVHPGNLAVRGGAALLVLPPRMTVRGDADFSGSAALAEVPDDLSVGGRISFDGCVSLLSFPAAVRVRSDLSLRRCASLSSLPHGFSVPGDLDAGDSGIESLPPGLRVGGRLSLSGCVRLSGFPGDASADGGIDLDGCSGLTGFGGGFRCAGSLGLRGCVSLASLPDRLHVGGYLDLTGCASLERLPEDMVILGPLYLEGCGGLRGMPDGIRVSGPIRMPDGSRAATAQAAREWFGRSRAAGVHPAPGMAA